MFYLIAGVAAAIALYRLVSTDNRSHPPPITRSEPHQSHERSYHEHPHHEHPRYVPHYDLPAKDPASLRAMASQEGQMMAQCFQQSQEAYERRDHTFARSLSERGKRHGLTMEKLNAKASAIIFKENNRDRPPSEVDLHGLYVKEAISHAEKALEKTLRRGDPELRFIVGRGNHSDGGVSKLKPAILGAMQIRGLEVEVDPRNPGVLVVLLDD